ncbi:uncharacterized protein [Anabrus simplex]|uniref:uncharacterized protein isoform X2 n=1 Tax=Anabrus simplex TaxID=316456 RepID=UPI0035A3C6C2
MLRKRTQSHDPVSFPAEAPSGDFEFQDFHSDEGEKENDDDDNYGLCGEDCCGFKDIPEEQASDCECILTQETVDSDVIYNSDAVCKETCDTVKSNDTKSVPKENVHTRRIRSFRKKIFCYLENICDLIGNIPEPDGIEELRRRQQRAAEFLSWVGRNYHYVLQKQILNIKKQTKRPCIGARNTFFNAISQKLVAAHQTTSQALQAYKHHLPSTVGRGVPEKLRELLKFLVELSHLTVKLGIIDYDGLQSEDVIETKSKTLLLKLKSKKEYEIETPGTHTSESQATVRKKVKKENLKTDLTMYEPKKRSFKPKGRCWKRSSAAHAKTKVGPTSKTKLVQPTNSKSSMSQGSSEESKKSRGTSKTDLNALRKPQRSARKKSIGTVACCIDNVETMMDYIPAEDSEDEEIENQYSVFPISEGTNRKIADLPDGELVKGELIETLIELTNTVRSQMEAGQEMEEQNPNTEKITAASIPTLKPGKGSTGNFQMVDIASLNQIKEIMQQLEEILPKPIQSNNNFQNKTSTKNPKKLKKLSKQTLTNQGVKGSDSSNVKLIFVEHDSSDDNINENSENEKNAKETTNNVFHAKTQNSQSSSSNLDFPTAVEHTFQEERHNVDEDAFIINKEEPTDDVPQNWEPNIDPKFKNGMIISFSSQHQYDDTLERQDDVNDAPETKLQYENIHPHNTKKGSEENWHPISTKKQSDHKTDYDSTLPLENVGRPDGFKRSPDMSSTKAPLIILTVSDTDKQFALDYRSKFHSYTSKKIMYEKQKKPWLITTRTGTNFTIAA